MDDKSPSLQRSAPPSMGGITRMHDPSELAHDRVRRRVMNIAFAFIIIGIGFDLYTFGWSARRAAFIVAWVVASVPLGFLGRLVELRFKMAKPELRHVLREVPVWAWVCLSAYFVFWFAAIFIAQWTPLIFNPDNGINVFGISIAWALFGAWLYDFLTYFRYRHERLRHIYMVMATVDDLRGFRKEVLYPLAALALQTLAFIFL